MAMAMAKKQEKMNFGANQGTRATVVVLGGLCMPHGRVIWTYGRYTTQNHQNARLPARLISRLIDCQPHGRIWVWFRIKILASTGKSLGSSRTHVGALRCFSNSSNRQNQHETCTGLLGIHPGAYVVCIRIVGGVVWERHLVVCAVLYDLASKNIDLTTSSSWKPTFSAATPAKDNTTQKCTMFIKYSTAKLFVKSLVIFFLPWNKKSQAELKSSSFAWIVNFVRTISRSLSLSCVVGR